MKLISDNNKTMAIVRTVYFILTALLLVIAYLYRLIFLAGCVICTILFGAIQIRLVSISRRNEAYQKRKCKLIGLVMLIPSFLMIANGIGLVFLPDIELPIKLSSGIIVISAVMTVGLSAQIFVYRKDSSLSARFLRFADCAALSSPVSLIVLLVLLLSSDEEASVIGCMTAVMFGVAALLIAVNMILTSICGYKTTQESIPCQSDVV